MNLPPPNPLGIPDTPEQAMSDFLFHAAVSGGAAGLAWVIAGSYPGPGHLGTMFRAFFSPAHVGASYAGTSALDDTLYALRVYSTPFRAVARVLGPIGMGILAMDVGRALTGSRTGGVYRDREWFEEYRYQLAGGDFQEQIAAARASREQ